MNIYDVAIIGAGIAGSFAAYRLAKEHKDLKCIMFDMGRPPAKRRRQLEGFLGCLPNSDGKLYLSDVAKVSSLTGNRKAKSALKSVTSIMEKVADLKITKDKRPSVSIEKKIKKLGFDIQANDYIQIFPKEIHALSKYLADSIEVGGNITYNFDNEVTSIAKQKSQFVISTQTGEEFKAKRLIICVGRSGWRWANSLYSNFGIIEDNNIAKYGIRVEMPSNCLKDFHKSNCTLIKKDDLEIGPLSWYGTVIPEDHFDMAISAFRSNENRWKTDKVSFSLIGDVVTNNQGFEQTNRIGQLIFVLANDRVIKEKVSTILNGKSTVSKIKEYDWLAEKIHSLSPIIPDLATKAYFHVPTITPLAPKINIGDNLESEVDGMFIAGESAGIQGILAAAMMGWSSAGEVAK